MRRKLAIVAACCAMAASGLAQTATVAGAAASLKVTKVFYDAPGTDTMSSNTSLNAEYVVVKNMTTKAINLKGWTVRDAQAHVYVFPSFSLAGGASVKVHSGSGTKNATNLFWNNGNFVWNNSGDTATLKNPAGTKVHACKYPNAAGGVKISGTSSTGKYATCP